MSSSLAASIHARLLNRAKMRGEDFNLLLTRYAIECFLYRLLQVPAREANAGGLCPTAGNPNDPTTKKAVLE